MLSKIAPNTLEGHIILAALLTLFVFSITPARALDANVRNACVSDYFRFCAYTVPGSASCKACFRQVGRRLSHQCRAAIKNSSEFASEYRRTARRYARR